MSGELVIEPVVDALVWRQDARFGGTPSTIPPTESTRLLPGDLVFLPAIPPDDVLEELPAGVLRTTHVLDANGTLAVPLPGGGGLRRQLVVARQRPRHGVGGEGHAPRPGDRRHLLDGTGRQQLGVHLF